MMYFEKDGKANEVSVGWCGYDLVGFKREFNSLPMKLQGGTPHTALEISKSDVHADRKGFAGILKIFGSNV